MAGKKFTLVAVLMLSAGMNAQQFDNKGGDVVTQNLNGVQINDNGSGAVQVTPPNYIGNNTFEWPTEVLPPADNSVPFQSAVGGQTQSINGAGGDYAGFGGNQILGSPCPVCHPSNRNAAANIANFAVIQIAISLASEGVGSFFRSLSGIQITGFNVPLRSAELAERAAEIHSVLHPIAQGMRTTAVASATDAEGTEGILVASSERTLSRVQREALQEGEIPVSGPGHAEETILNYANESGWTVNSMGVTRIPCFAGPNCEMKLIRAGVDVSVKITP
jgi:hypothetical protein